MPASAKDPPAVKVRDMSSKLFASIPSSTREAKRKKAKKLYVYYVLKKIS